VSELDQVTLNAGDKSVVLPVLKPTLGNDCIDVSKLTRETGLFTYDSGFTATASCKSAITYIDGDNGVLLYRGYPIEQLAQHSSFLEVSYLLMNGELPTKEEFARFEHEVTHHTMMHESLKNFLHGFHYDAHPMAMLSGTVASLSAGASDIWRAIASSKRCAHAAPASGLFHSIRRRLWTTLPLETIITPRLRSAFSFAARSR